MPAPKKPIVDNGKENTNKRLRPRQRPFRFFIGKGNNPDIIRDVFANRPWWDEIEQEEIDAGTLYNLKWKQLNYRKSEMDALGCCPRVRQTLNHFENNMEICSKAGLLRNMLYYYDRVLEKNAFEAVPVTYNVSSARDPEFLVFSEKFMEYEKRKIAKLGPKKVVVKPVEDEEKEGGGEEEDEEEEESSEVKEKTPRPGTRSEKRIMEDSKGDKPAWRAGGASAAERLNANSPKKTRLKDGQLGSPKRDEAVANPNITGRFADRTLEEKDSLYNIWILKPGTGTNRGVGVKVFDTLEACKNHMEKWGNRKYPTFNWIIQKYMERPLLIHNRKFDIRAYAVVTHNLELYFYEEGYLRTSCQKFTMDNVEDRNIHLTNWAVQKKAESYGEFEDANQMDFAQFQAHLDQFYANDKIDFRKHLLPQMKELCKNSYLSAEKSLNINNRKQCFELFGYDFMIDQDYKVWLIEVNNNPCLCTPGETTGELLPQLIEDVFKISVDPLYPESGDCMWKRAPKVSETKFTKLAQGTFTEPMLNRQMKRGPITSHVSLPDGKDKEKVRVSAPTIEEGEAYEEEDGDGSYEEEQEEASTPKPTPISIPADNDEDEGVYHEDGYATGVCYASDTPVRGENDAPSKGFGDVWDLGKPVASSLANSFGGQHTGATAQCIPIQPPVQLNVTGESSTRANRNPRASAVRQITITSSNPIALNPRPQRETIPLSLVHDISVCRTDPNWNRPQSPASFGEKMDKLVVPEPQSTPSRQSQPGMSSRVQSSPLLDREGGNLPKVGDRFKGNKLYTGRMDSKRGDLRGGLSLLKGSGNQQMTELPDIRETAKPQVYPHRETPKVVKEAAIEAEDVARQLRDAGLIAEAAALERLRAELMAPGADLAAKKVEARVLAEKLRAQAKEKTQSRRFVRQVQGLQTKRSAIDHRNLPSVLGMSIT